MAIGPKRLDRATAPIFDEALGADDPVRQFRFPKTLVMPHHTNSLVGLRDEFAGMGRDIIQLNGKMNLDAFVVMDVELDGPV